MRTSPSTCATASQVPRRCEAPVCWRLRTRLRNLAKHQRTSAAMWLAGCRVCSCRQFFLSRFDGDARRVQRRLCRRARVRICTGGHLYSNIGVLTKLQVYGVVVFCHVAAACADGIACAHIGYWGHPRRSAVLQRTGQLDIQMNAMAPPGRSPKPREPDIHASLAQAWLRYTRLPGPRQMTRLRVCVSPTRYKLNRRIWMHAIAGR